MAADLGARAVYRLPLLLPRHVLMLEFALSLPVAIGLAFFPSFSLYNMKLISTPHADELQKLMAQWWGLASFALPAAFAIALWVGTERTQRKTVKYLVIPLALLHLYMVTMHTRFVAHQGVLKGPWFGSFISMAIDVIVLGLSLLSMFNVHTKEGRRSARLDSGESPIGNDPVAAKGKPIASLIAGKRE